MVLALLVCGVAFGEPPREIEVAIFAGGYGLKFFEETARQFEQAHPGLRVNLYGDPRINDKVRIRVLEGSYPNATDASGLPWLNLIKGAGSGSGPGDGRPQLGRGREMEGFVPARRAGSVA
jgi:ABC-type glycerol-3-phosphate transport system substrate-binding protein